MEPDIKARIMNTVRSYEAKCDKLYADIAMLKESLKEFTLLPKGVYADLDEYISRLEASLHDLEKPKDIKQNVSLLRDALAGHLIARHNQNEIIESRINKILGKLLNHLIIPEEFQPSVDNLEKMLETQLQNESLFRVIDEITLLIADTSHAEQEQFKDFFQLFTTQLHDFNEYLSMVMQNQDLLSRDSTILELNITKNVSQIRDQIQKTTILRDMFPALINNLEAITNKIREYRHKEAEREKEHGKQIDKLKEQLKNAEHMADTMKSMMSAQHFKINHDGLTGLANRFSYDDRIVEAINRSKRNNGELCLAILDIDHFKQINDNYGHLAGDKVLKNIAWIFKNSIRAVDFLARYGGEEFVIILENTTRQNAVLVMDKLRKLVEEARFYYGNNRVEVTLSAGISSYTPSENPEVFFARADKALYEAKNTGRNKVVLI